MAPSSEKFGVGAVLDNGAVLEHDNAVGVFGDG
ncbi:Uncharacterised protein [Mycobacterium tuberculosis]|nr:Uncharacterised protein [Mycobacterium tuberculosis]